MLLFVPKNDQARVREALGELLHIPFQFEINGSQIIFYDPKVDDFSHINDEREDRDLKCFTERKQPQAIQMGEACQELRKTGF